MNEYGANSDKFKHEWGERNKMNKYGAIAKTSLDLNERECVEVWVHSTFRQVKTWMKRNNKMNKYGAIVKTILDLFRLSWIRVCMIDSV